MKWIIILYHFIFFYIENFLMFVLVYIDYKFKKAYKKSYSVIIYQTILPSCSLSKFNNLYCYFIYY